MEILISMDNNSYLIAYSAEQGDYNKYLPLAQQMINSFEITNPPAQSLAVDQIQPGQCQYFISACES